MWPGLIEQLEAECLRPALGFAALRCVTNGVLVIQSTSCENITHQGYAAERTTLKTNKDKRVRIVEMGAQHLEWQSNITRIFIQDKFDSDFKF